MRHLMLCLALAGWPALAQEEAAQPADQVEDSRAADPAQTLQGLIEAIEQGRARESAENRARVQDFTERRNEQAQLLQQAEQRLADLKARAEALEEQFTENELSLERYADLLRQRTGSFGELFGVLREASGELANQLDASPVNAQLGGERVAFLQAMAEEDRIPTLEELERLWLDVMRETVQLGRVVTFTAPVVRPSGETDSVGVTRIGPFTLLDDDLFLEYLPQEQAFQELPRQPAGRYRAVSDRFQQADGSFAPAVIDPSRGAILSAVVQAPDLRERLAQAGPIGVIILSLAGIGVIIVVERLITLSLVGIKIRRQRKSQTLKANNPLGRVLKVAPDNPNESEAVLERLLEEQIMTERVRLERGLPLVKVLVAAAPLLGLLGTVTGMIGTFEVMSLFGAGNPQLMAGGISQALITTALGLVAAIPLLLLHSLAKSQSDSLVEILSEQAAGLMVERSRGTDRSLAYAAE